MAFRTDRLTTTATTTTTATATTTISTTTKNTWKLCRFNPKTTASRFTQEISLIYSTIVFRKYSVGVRFNNWITVPLTLQDPHAHSLLPIRPYHTLLLMEGATHDLPVESLPALKRLMDAAKPTKSFRELQLETGINLSFCGEKF